VLKELYMGRVTYTLIVESVFWSLWMMLLEMLPSSLELGMSSMKVSMTLRVLPMVLKALVCYV
jgi:hypothetical protein